MHPQLQTIVDEFEAASERLTSLCATTPADRWGERVHPDRWSVAECVALRSSLPSTPGSATTSTLA